VLRHVSLRRQHGRASDVNKASEAFQSSTRPSFDWTLPYASRRQPILARNVVATSQPLATRAGVAMLHAGGKRGRRGARDRHRADHLRSRAATAWAATCSPSCWDGGELVEFEDVGPRTCGVVTGPLRARRRCRAPAGRR
jgi:hypothetical protein